MSSKLMPQFRPHQHSHAKRNATFSQGFGQVQQPLRQTQGGDSRHIVVSVLNQDSGRNMLNKLQQSSESFGLEWVGTLASQLRDAGVMNWELTNKLPHLFALLRIQERQQSDAAALRELYRFECRNSSSNKPPFVSAEPDYPLHYSIDDEIGADYDLRSHGSFHDGYRDLLNVQDAHDDGYGGEDVTVAVVDSGVEKGGIATDFQDLQDFQNQNEIDGNGHGTAMTSIICDIAPKASVHAIRISDGIPRMWKFMMGVGSAAFHFKADIINLSMGLDSVTTSCSKCGMSSAGLSTNLENFLEGIANFPIGVNGPPLLVASCGNESSTSGFSYPAAWDFVLAVGAINSAKKRSGFSNYEQHGSHSKFFVMPGGDEDSSGTPTEWIGEGASAKCLGTSPATAYASAMLALYYSSGSTLRNKDRDKFLRDVLAKCDDSSPADNADEYGKGFLPYIR